MTATTRALRVFCVCLFLGLFFPPRQSPQALNSRIPIGGFCFPTEDDESSSENVEELRVATAESNRKEAVGEVAVPEASAPGLMLGDDEEERQFLFGGLSDGGSLLHDELAAASREAAAGGVDSTPPSAGWELAARGQSPRLPEEELPSSTDSKPGAPPLRTASADSGSRSPLSVHPNLSSVPASSLPGVDSGDKTLSEAEAALKAQLLRAEQHLQGLASDVSLLRRSVQELYVVTEEDSERHPNQRLLEMLDSSVRTLPERLSLYAQGNATEFASQLEDATASKLMALYQEYLSSSFKTAALFSDFSSLTATLRKLERQTDVTAGDHLDKLRVWGASKSAMFREALQESQAKLLQSFAEYKHKEQTRVNIAVLEELHVKAAALGAATMLEERGFGVVDLSECCAGFDARRVGQLLLYEVLKAKSRRLKVIPILITTKPPPEEPLPPPPVPHIPRVEVRGSSGVRRLPGVEDMAAGPAVGVAALDEVKVPLLDKVADFRKLALAVTDELMAARMDVLEKVLPTTAKASLKARLARLRASKAREKAREHLSPLPHASWGWRRQRRSIIPPLYTLQLLVRDAQRVPTRRSSSASASSESSSTSGGSSSSVGNAALGAAASAAFAYPFLLVSVEGALLEAFRVDRASAISVPVQYPPPYVPLGAPVPHSSYGVALEKAFLFVRKEDALDAGNAAAPSAYSFQASYPSPCDETPLAAERGDRRDEEQKKQGGEGEGGTGGAETESPSVSLPQHFNPFEKCVRAKGPSSRKRWRKSSVKETPREVRVKSSSDGDADSEVVDFGETNFPNSDSGSEIATLTAGEVFDFLKGKLQREDQDFQQNSSNNTHTTSTTAEEAREKEGVGDSKQRSLQHVRRLSAADNLLSLLGTSDAGESALKLLHPALFEFHDKERRRTDSSTNAETDTLYNVGGQNATSAFHDYLKLNWSGSRAKPDIPSLRRASVSDSGGGGDFEKSDTLFSLFEREDRSGGEAPLAMDGENDSAQPAEGESEEQEEEEEVVLIAYAGSRDLGLPLISEGEDGGRAAEQRRLLLQQSSWQLQKRLALRSGVEDERADELDVRAELLAMRREVRLLQPRSWALHSVTKHIPAIDVSLSVAFGNAPTLLLPLTPFFQRSVLLVRLHVRRCDGGLFAAPPASALKKALMLASYPGGAHGAALHCLQRIAAASSGGSRCPPSHEETSGVGEGVASRDDNEEDPLHRFDSAETPGVQPTGDPQTHNSPQTPLQNSHRNSHHSHHHHSSQPHHSHHHHHNHNNPTRHHHHNHNNPTHHHHHNPHNHNNNEPRGTTTTTHLNEETGQGTSSRPAVQTCPSRSASLHSSSAHSEELASTEPLDWVVQSWALHNGAGEESQVVVHAAVAADLTQLYVQPGTVGTLSWLLQKTDTSGGAAGREKDAGAACRSARGFFAGSVQHGSVSCLSPRQLVSAVFANMAAGAVPDLFQPALRGRLVVVAISPEESGAPGEASLAVELLAVAEARDAARRRATRKVRKEPEKRSDAPGK